MSEKQGYDPEIQDLKDKDEEQAKLISRRKFLENAAWVAGSVALAGTGVIIGKEIDREEAESGKPRIAFGKISEIKIDEKDGTGLVEIKLIHRDEPVTKEMSAGELRSMKVGEDISCQIRDLKEGENPKFKGQNIIVESISKYQAPVFPAARPL